MLHDARAMWVASKIGFFSIVHKDDHLFHVRARTRGDIERLCRATNTPVDRVVVTPESDYRYRIVVQGNGISRVFNALQSSITYRRFRTQISDNHQRDKIPVYSGFWDAMRAYQANKLEEEATPWPN